MKRVCLISTKNHNVGDDFVREGILCLLREVLGDFEAEVIHKHFPATARGGLWTWIDQRTRGLPNRFDWRSRLSRLADLLPLNAAKDKVLGSDVLVQSGAPVYWKNPWSTCARTEWFTPLVEKRWRRIQARVPLLNLGAGSCQAWGSDGGEIVADAECRAFIDRFTRWSALTTVRDPLAQRILRQCGHEVPLLPCPSIFAPGSLGLSGAGAGEHIALNYMPLGGHYDLAGRGDAVRQQWEDVFRATARDLARQHDCLLICHDHAELAAAERLLPELPRFHSTDWRDYLKAYSRCRMAVVNRVHGAVVTAAMGRPVLLTGNDTRLLTAAEVPGITVLPVHEAQHAFHGQVEALQSMPAGVPPTAFIEAARLRYLELLRPIFPA
ncbi:MAG TPA: polysaccharide pyruvyl transferase family protein [Prosthecobacter sp.]